MSKRQFYLIFNKNVKLLSEQNLWVVKLHGINVSFNKIIMALFVQYQLQKVEEQLVVIHPRQFIIIQVK